MTIAQGGEFIQRLVKNGIVRGRDTLTKQDYQNLVMLACDYILFQKKGIGDLMTSNASVVNIPKVHNIQDSLVTLPKEFNVQGIVQFELLTRAQEKLDIAIFPLNASAKNMADQMFTWYIPLAGQIEFLNLPFNAKKVRIYAIAGSDINDNITNDIMYLIIDRALKIGQLSEQKRKDTSADGNTQDDGLENQIRQLINQTNAIA